MKRLRPTLAIYLLAVALVSSAPATASQDNPKPAPPPNLSGLHDFDFLVGECPVRSAGPEGGIRHRSRLRGRGRRHRGRRRRPVVRRGGAAHPLHEEVDQE